ncbi:MAG TPA: PhzF family phenazine biosynthesis protein [Actinomycetota bacterium]|jgi:trans-2,3-dihydro-3-hydroxyanthranilate isomerase
MRLPFRLVDVFTEVPFAGNQLCVVPEAPTDLSTVTMQTLAREIGFSETTFVSRADERGYDVRIFTPIDELPFAGHPTLGTAFTLAELGRTGTSVLQTCGAGEIPVEVDLEAGTARMRQLPPEFGPEVTDRAAVARAAGLEPTDLVEGLPLLPASTGIFHLLVPVRDEATLRRAVRDPRASHERATAADAESLYLFTVRDDGDVLARMFDKDDSIGEDPATGSAAGPLGAYLAEHGLAGMPGAVTVSQGEMVGRSSSIEVEVEADEGGWTVWVAGGVRTVGDGAFEVPATPVRR